MGRSAEDQKVGGVLNIPDGYFVTTVDMDAREPYCKIVNNKSPEEDEKRISIPKSLAYYLTTHFCGSESMRKLIQMHALNECAQNIRKALMLDKE